MPDGLLPVHGFVLAGGKSSRMRRDKALLPFRGRPMVEIAVEKLRGFCSAVSIAGNREDLSGFAPVVPEQRVECGPAAGIEAGLLECVKLHQDWAVFSPVDVPLVPSELLQNWVRAALIRFEGTFGVSYLRVGGLEQPAFCLVPSAALATIESWMEANVRSIRKLLDKAAGEERWPIWIADAEAFTGVNDVSALFLNVNTADDLSDAEAAFAISMGKGPDVLGQRTSDPLRG